MSDLSAPLSRRKARQARSLPPPPGMRRFQFPVTRVALGMLLLIGVGIAMRVALVEDPAGGRPTTTLEIASIRDANPVAAAHSGEPATIEVGPEIPVDMFDPVLDDVVEDHADLLEATEFGAIPRIAASGETPFEAYSRPSDVPISPGRPAVAIVVSGLGLNLAGTLDAIQRLPDTVTLAFAPYGKSLDRTVSAARAEGHELFLEVPLEPFDYPDNDPGPDTLLTGQPPRENLARLFAVMSRFTGYAGLINNMGARFTASGADFGPMMEELGARGLGYVDDGTSNRSLAPQLARANRVPFNRVDLMIDANPARGAILEQLATLEARARSTGSAIGIASALPVSIEAITEWARTLADRNIEIVPLSALMKDRK